MVHLVGNAHLDPAWMWRMDEGLEAFAATCRSALDRINEFPDFIFTCSSAAHYAFVEETDPKLFARIQKAVRDERWSIVGGWWVEPDCNLPSGESFVRQALLGQRYFQSRFGKIATVGYCVDSFGHNANIPQLLRKAGMDSYVFMRPGQEEKALEADLFAWEAPSGDKVKAYRLPLHYSSFQYSIGEKLRLLPELEHYTREQPWMIFYGVGNHGGGPTIAQLREIETLRSDRAVGSDIMLSEPANYFAGVDLDSLPVIKGEMQRHAIGCYSAHSEIKRLNRRAENALTQAESLSVLATLAGVSRVTANFEQAWKNVCFNQFHDILGGVAIREACDDAITMYREAISIAERSTRTNLQRLASRIDTSEHIENLIVFNPSAFDREELIEFELWHPEASERGDVLTSVVLRASGGEEIGTQKIESSGMIGEDRVRFLAKVRVPALGWSVYGIVRGAVKEMASNIVVRADRISSGSASVGFAVSDQFEFDEGEGVPFGVPEGVDFEYTHPLWVDDTSDTWAHGLTSFYTEGDDPWDLCFYYGRENGPLRGAMLVANESVSEELSWLEQEIYVRPDSREIEIRGYLHWSENGGHLKLRFPHGCKEPVSRYEIPYSSIERPVGQDEWPGQSWVDVSERDGSRGFALITDSKYSYSVDDEYIYVILARSSYYAHHVPPHKFAPRERAHPQDIGVQKYRLLLVPHDGDWRTADLPRLSEQLHKPLIVHHESRHEGDLPRTYSGLTYSGEGVRIGAIKQAEDGDGIIVRAVEERGLSTSGSFRIPALDAEWTAYFSRFEIKTFLVTKGSPPRRVEVDLIERPI